MSAPLRLTISEARRFHRRAVRLDGSASDSAEVLQRLGFLQIDPINVCGRMHDLVLRNRVAHYQEGDLMVHLHGPSTSPFSGEERSAIEQHLPHSHNLAAMPVESWPFLQRAMLARKGKDGAWSGKLDPRQKKLARDILSEIAARGPLSSDDVADGQRDDQGWGASASLAKTTLHKLFFHGRVLIAKREKQRRFYDLPERVLPASVLNAKEPSEAEVARWVILLRLRQLRLTTLLRNEIPLVEDCVQAIAVEGCPLVYCLREDVPLLDNLPAPDPAPRLLAPLDPLIYHRRLTRCLWGMDYTWEVYTPPAKRRLGYYALPVLAGEEFVGHIDPKADRKSGTLVIANRSIKRGCAVAPAIRELTTFLGLLPASSRKLTSLA